MRRLHYKMEEFEQAFKELKLMFNSSILSKLEREFETLYSLLPKKSNSSGFVHSEDMRQICYLVFFQEFFYQAGVHSANSDYLNQKLADLKRDKGPQMFEEELDNIIGHFRLNLYQIVGQLESAWLLFIIAMQLVEKRNFTNEEVDALYVQFSSSDGPIDNQYFFYDRAKVFLIGGYGVGDFHSLDIYSII